MNRFYKVAITKWPVGSAVEHREPAVQGHILTKVTDSTTGGDFKLFLVDGDEAQHQTNLSLAGVEELAEEQAVRLAAEYQPQRTFKRFNPQTRQEEQISVPTLDLRKFYQKQV
jgi:hypothetical protein